MNSLLRRLAWWLRPSRKENEIREELQFHGNEARVREEVRAVWTWRPLDELSQDLRYAFRTLFKYRAVTIFAVLSLALGIGANTAIYSFMDAILMRSLPIADPASLVDVMWRAKARNSREEAFVLHSIDGSTYRYSGGMAARIFPFAAYEQLRNAAAPVMSSLLTYFSAGRLNVIVHGDAELSAGEYVGGNFFAGLAVSPAAGRLLGEDDNRPGAPGVAVVSHSYSERRLGGAANAVGQQILINNTPFTVVGVTPPEFFGVDL